MTKNIFEGICPECSTLISSKFYQGGDVKCPYCGNVIDPKITKDLLKLFVKEIEQKANKEILGWIGERLPEITKVGLEREHISVSISLPEEKRKLFILEKEGQIKGFIEKIARGAREFIRSHPEIENVDLGMNELSLLGIWIIKNPGIIEEGRYSTEDRYYHRGKPIGHEINKPWYLDIGTGNFLTSRSEEVTIKDFTGDRCSYTTAHLTPITTRELVVIVTQYNSKPEILFFAPTRAT